MEFGLTSRRELWITDPVILCYRRSMKNITVSVPDEVYRQARVSAAEQGKSVSALVTEFLKSLSDRDAEFARLEALQRKVQAEITNFSAGDRLSRDELYDRAMHREVR